MTSRSNPFPRLPSVDPQSLHWYGFKWTPWFPFHLLVDQRRATSFAWLNPEWCDGAGVYRFRMPDRDYLLYIGEALRMVNRMRQHRRAADRLRRKSEPRALRSSRFDWRLGTQLSRNPGRIEVSWTLCDAGRRKGLELELIELHRVTLARMPQWQLLVQLRPEEALEKSQERARRWLRRHPQQARLEQERPATPARNSSP